LQVLTALCFYARGSHQHDVAKNNALNVSQTMVSRCINEVSRAIKTVLLNRWVRFPQTLAEKNAVKRGYVINLPSLSVGQA
jgi:hypothetical protein